eukprot:10288950-Alexandrium_andersonii.AAC.1
MPSCRLRRRSQGFSDRIVGGAPMRQCFRSARCSCSDLWTVPRVRCRLQSALRRSSSEPAQRMPY